MNSDLQFQKATDKMEVNEHVHTEEQPETATCVDIDLRDEEFARMLDSDIQGDTELLQQITEQTESTTCSDIVFPDLDIERKLDADIQEDIFSLESEKELAETHTNAGIDFIDADSEQSLEQDVEEDAEISHHPNGTNAVESSLRNVIRGLKEHLFGGDRYRDDYAGEHDRALSNARRIPAEVFQSLPKMIRTVVDQFKHDHTREIVLTSIIAAISACLANVFGRYFDIIYGTQILLGLLSPAGGGKGNSRYAVRMVKPIDKRLFEMGIADWKARKEECGEGEEIPPYVPVRLLLPVDSSAAGLVEFLNESKWPVFMYDSEIDTLVAVLRNDWGQISHLLRKAAEHEPFSVQRKGVGLRVERPELAMCLSGTLGQFLKLIPSSEDGLFSRIAWLYVPTVDTWISPRPGGRTMFPEEVIDIQAKELDVLHRRLLERAEPLEVKLQEHHWDLVDEVYTELKAKARENGYGGNLDSILHRNGALAFRIAMVFTILRQIDKVKMNPNLKNVIAADRDVEAGLALALVHLDHAFRLHGRLPLADPGPVGRNDDAQRLYDQLPNTFSRSTAISIAAHVEIAERTADKYLNLLVDTGQLTRLKRGKYAKSGHEKEDGFKRGF